MAAVPEVPLKKKCFVLMAEMAAVSGGLDPKETEVLGGIGQTMGLDMGFATKALEVAMHKFASA